MREETIPLKDFLARFKEFPEDSQLFFGCPDEANPLEFVGVEQDKTDYIRVKFRLMVYKGSD